MFRLQQWSAEDQAALQELKAQYHQERQLHQQVTDVMEKRAGTLAGMLKEELVRMKWESYCREMRHGSCKVGGIPTARVRK